MEDNKRPSPARTALFGCLSIILFIAVIEFALRMAALIAGLAQPPTVQDKYVQHPYLEHTMRPNYTETDSTYPTGGEFVFETNSLGFRGDEFSVDKPEGIVRIVVIGASAVVTGRTNDLLFTALLQDLLNEEFPDTEIEVINAGVPGYTSTQELFLLETQIVGWNPDLVLIYDGRNDALQASMPDYIPGWTQRDQEVIAALAGQEDVVRRHLFTWDLLSRYVFQVEPHPERDYNTPRGKEYDYTAHPEGVEIYARNLESMLLLLQGYAITPALAFQPILIMSKKNLAPEEQTISDALAPAFVAAQRDLLPQAAARAGEVADRRDVPFLDLTALFDDQPERMFLDDVHQTDAANEIIARALFDLLAPLIRLALADS